MNLLWNSPLSRAAVSKAIASAISKGTGEEDPQSIEPEPSRTTMVFLWIELSSTISFQAVSK